MPDGGHSDDEGPALDDPTAWQEEDPQLHALDEDETNTLALARILRQTSAEQQAFLNSATASMPPAPHIELPAYPAADDLKWSPELNKHLKQWNSAVKGLNQSAGPLPLVYAAAGQMEELTLTPGPVLSARVDIFDLAGLATRKLVGSHQLEPTLPPPYVRMVTPPTVWQTQQLFTLDAGQRPPFERLAHALLNGTQMRPSRQEQVIIFGNPGCGKSRVLLALLWHAFQHKVSSRVAVLAYTWKAAQNVETPTNAGSSTCKFFQINPFNHSAYTSAAAMTTVQDNLRGVTMLFIDEFSFLSCRHLLAIHSVCLDTMRSLLGNRALDAPFGGLHVVLSGDICQHPPPNATPLFRRPPATGSMPGGAPRSETNQIRLDADARGRKLWTDMTDVYELGTSHRLNGADPSSSQLHA